MRAGGDWWHLVHIINFKCQVAIVQGDARGAASGCREAIARSRHLGITSALPDSVALLGGALVVGDHPERLGDTMIVSSRRELYRQQLGQIEEQLGAGAMAEAWQAGRAAALDDVIGQSLAVFDDVPLDELELNSPPVLAE